MKLRWIIALIGVGAAGVLAVVFLDRLARIPAGYMAKMACSEVFVAGRPVEAVLESDFNDVHPTFPHVRLAVDEDAGTVSGSLFALGGASARHRDGHGCTLARAGASLSPLTPLTGLEDSGDEAMSATAAAADAGGFDVDTQAIEAALDDAFADESAAHRAVVVMVGGRIVAERYAPGFDDETRFVSWSMAKSVTATLVGLAVEQRYVEVGEGAPSPEWVDDERARITWNDLMRMQSGLAFEEDYGDPGADVNQMLFNSQDGAALAANKPAAHAPGEVWYYSSGSTNILARALTSRLEGNGVDLFTFARERLFEPIGATSFVLEPDASGVFVGSSYAYATARDWARLGQLYLQDGVWGGARILPAEWVEYVAAPTRASDGQYGASFWLNREGDDGRDRFVPGLPEEMFFMSGHEGQYVFIIPSKRMVVVRTGLTRDRPPLQAVKNVAADVYGAVTSR